MLGTCKRAVRFDELGGGGFLWGGFCDFSTKSGGKIRRFFILRVRY